MKLLQECIEREPQCAADRWQEFLAPGFAQQRANGLLHQMGCAAGDRLVIMSFAQMNANPQSGQTNAPEEFDYAEAARLLNEASAEASLDKRIELISAYFMGRPYIDAPLGGGTGLPEVFRVSLEAFDCVTYIETVLAFALAVTPDEFVETIRHIRYEEGRIDWVHRNHYMIDWARRNEARGFIANITTGADTLEKTCELKLIAGLPETRPTFRYFPKQSLPVVEAIAATGDLLLFVSAKDTLDVFHTGLLIKLGSSLLLRHATRTAGAVIEQPLIEFVNNNKMAGLILLRPLCPR